MNVGELNVLSRPAFVDAVGWVFEHSPWVADRTWQQRPFGSIEALHRAMVNEVEQATKAEQLALLRAHPDLGAGKKMSAASVAEQTGAGLDQLSAEDHERLGRLNREYRERFGFPFLFAVKGSTRRNVLEALEKRLGSAAGEEFQEALRQVYRIAWFRLERPT